MSCWKENKQKAIQAGVATQITLDYTRARMKDIQEKVKALTAHVNRDEVQFSKTLTATNIFDHKVLAWQLYKELCSVIKAVEEAQ